MGGVPQELENFSLSELRIIRYLCETDPLYFLRFFFKLREGNRFLLGGHHPLVANTLRRVLTGEITRLIINIPPGYTKTEAAVIAFMALGIAIQPTSRFMHLSYSDDLALTNSSKVKAIIEHPVYQYFWPRTLQADQKSKKLWHTKEGGGLMAASTGGQVTGFRAGYMTTGFSGALIIDDPLKPDDAYSDVLRERVNNRYINTIASRLAQAITPVVVIMQRIHENDLTGFLLSGGSKEKWYHLDIAADNRPRSTPIEWTHRIPVEFDLPEGPVWPRKHSAQDLRMLAESDPYTYASQYDQRPYVEGGGVFKVDNFTYYQKYDIKKALIEYENGKRVKLLSKHIFADTAVKKGEHNDYTVIQCWGLGEDRKIYLLDQIRGKWESTDLTQLFLTFCDKHTFRAGETGLGVQSRKVEDKVSGMGLIQDINRVKGVGFVEGIQRDRDKLARANSGAPQVNTGRVVLPKDEPWVNEYVMEFARFTPTMSHRYDDQIDPTMDAIHDLILVNRVFDLRKIIYS